MLRLLRAVPSTSTNTANASPDASLDSLSSSTVAAVSTAQSVCRVTSTDNSCPATKPCFATATEEEQELGGVGVVQDPGSAVAVSVPSSIEAATKEHVSTTAKT